MAVPAEHRALHHAIDDLATATTSLRSTHGDVVVVARLRNDLEGSILDDDKGVGGFRGPADRPRR